MNKDYRAENNWSGGILSMSCADAFNLCLSNSAIERELTRIKRPVVNIENMPRKGGQILKLPLFKPLRVSGNQ